MVMANELVKRRLRDAEFPSRLSPHSFRVTEITACDYRLAGVAGMV
jgi:hypothetical protein